jgi:hypothetical protein
VVFDDDANDLVFGDFNGARDIFAFSNTPDAPLFATGASVTATEAAPFTGVVASFVDADPRLSTSRKRPRLL